MGNSQNKNLSFPGRAWERGAKSIPLRHLALRLEQEFADLADIVGLWRLVDVRLQMRERPAGVARMEQTQTQIAMQHHLLRVQLPKPAEHANRSWPIRSDESQNCHS